MTDKEFVLSIYPTARAIHTTWNNPTFWLIWCPSFSKDLNYIRGTNAETEPSAWEKARIILEKILLKKLME